MNQHDFFRDPFGLKKDKFLNSYNLIKKNQLFEYQIFYRIN